MVPENGLVYDIDRAEEPIAFIPCAAEAVRDRGGHALVVVDDLAPLVGCWEHLVLALVSQGPDFIRQGLIKDSEGREVDLAPQVLMHVHAVGMNNCRMQSTHATISMVVDVCMTH